MGAEKKVEAQRQREYKMKKIVDREIQKALKDHKNRWTYREKTIKLNIFTLQVEHLLLTDR